MKWQLTLSICLGMAAFGTAPAETIFFDDFENGASPLWGNEYGDWVADDGVYTAMIQSNNPPTYSSVTSLPELTNFAIDVDINGVRDGGIYMRSHWCDNGLVDGVILVVGGNVGTYNGCYWHVGDCDGFSPALNAVEIPGLQGSDIHIRIEVTGDYYRAYINGEAEPFTSLTTDAYQSGRVALYEFFDQSYDNVAISTFPVGVDGEGLPERSQINSIHPNPFNPQTRISFSLAHSEPAEIGVYDMTGRRITVLADRSFAAGTHSVTWHGRNFRGRAMPSGSYLVRMETAGRVEAKKVMLIR